MRKVTITQTNPYGDGKDRVREFWVQPGQVDAFIARKSRAFNMDRTTITAN